MQAIFKHGFLAILTLCAMVGGLVLMQSDDIGAFPCAQGDPVCDPFELGPRTKVVTGTSTVDCPWAEMDFHHQVDQLCGIGTCNVSFSNIDPCSNLEPGPWEYSATVTYQCLGCEGGFGGGF
ncbi:MAG TPA: hypothetical protein VLV83_00405 [Acidobacteriota bacterium]|nr:hypothetical protein [Acidobacteriota bacterium]